MEAVHQVHKKSVKGGKSKKKASKVPRKKGQNVKAFSFSGGVTSVQRRVQRKLDLAVKKERAELTVKDKSVSGVAPVIVAVQGPSGVGKSTLIRSLVKHYSKTNLNGDTKSPITMTASKQRRLTLLEVPSNSLTAMIDIAKISDLVLLLIDASFGFEMETFEFINILQVHGFPRIIGILTHLDKFKDNKSQKKTKKKLKSRFWSEIYDGAKLFYFSGIHFNQKYNKTETANLCRFIAIQKFNPLQFRSQRPYLLALRYEFDQLPTPSQDKKTNSEKNGQPRTLKIYGYLKGSPFRNHAVHIPGAGDFVVQSMRPCLDPCPVAEAPNMSSSKNDGNKALRTLKSQERRVYAPDSKIGNVFYDDDSMFISLPDVKVGFTKQEDENSEDLPEAVSMVRDLQEAHAAIDAQSQQLQIKLLQTSTNATPDPPARKRRRVPEGKFKAVGNKHQKSHSDDSSLDDTDAESDDADPATPDPDSVSRDGNSSDGQPDEEDQADSGDETTASTSASEGPRIHWSGDESGSSSDGSDNVGEVGSSNRAALFAAVNAKPSLDDLVYSSLQTDPERPGSRELNDVQKQDARKDLFQDDEEKVERARTPTPFAGVKASQQNAEESNVFPSLEMGRVLFKDLGVSALRIGSIKKELRRRYFITGGWEGSDPGDASEEGEEVKVEAEGSGVKEPASEATEAATANGAKAAVGAGAEAAGSGVPDGLFEATTFLKESKVGAVVGEYVRLVISDVPLDWLESLKSEQLPLIVGGLLSGETALGEVRSRVKKHRWAPKILKSHDPLLISIGWRRYQSIPLYAMEDRNDVRVRMLKYTPEHMHCLATFYGPWTAPGSGIIMIKNWESNLKSFRISATGTVLEVSPNFQIEKKLKLVGVPKKVGKKTSFIQRMFNSDLEVAKFIGAKIQTVSGVRGQIKQSLGHDGIFRATFEDKILMSDLVLCKCWIKVSPIQFWNPLIDVHSWRKLRTQAEIRRDLQLPPADSRVTNYGKKPERQTRRFNPLQIPKDVEKSLPFASRPKYLESSKSPTKLTASMAEALAPPRSDYEKATDTLFNRLSFMQKSRVAKDAEKKKLRKIEKETEKNEKTKNNFQREDRKRRIISAEKNRARDRKRLRLT